MVFVLVQIQNSGYQCILTLIRLEITLTNNPISWSSKKQKIIAHSFTEAEYRAVTSALTETTWVKNLLMELGVTLS
jgi:hypothetical protein